MHVCFFSFLFDMAETAAFVRVQITGYAFCLASLTATILKITLSIVFILQLIIPVSGHLSAKK